MYIGTRGDFLMVGFILGQPAALIACDISRILSMPAGALDVIR
jgi:hypothetical protein